MRWKSRSLRNLSQVAEALAAMDLASFSSRLRAATSSSSSWTTRGQGSKHVGVHGQACTPRLQLRHADPINKVSVHSRSCAQPPDNNHCVSHRVALVDIRHQLASFQLAHGFKLIPFSLKRLTSACQAHLHEEVAQEVIHDLWPTCDGASSWGLPCLCRRSLHRCMHAPCCEQQPRRFAFMLRKLVGACMEDSLFAHTLAVNACKLRSAASKSSLTPSSSSSLQ